MKNLILTLTFLLAVTLQLFAQWSTDPMENTVLSTATGDQAIPKVATSVNGITYISWFSMESGNYYVRLQKLDVFGNKLWDDAGLLVSDKPSMTWLTDWDMTVDADDCAILTFQDIRNSGYNDVFAYRISSEGEFLWGDDGIEMSIGQAFDVSPKVCVTGSGNLVFAWQADAVVILQKISPAGDKLWGDDGITLSGSNTFSWPQLMPAGTDEVILKYFEDSGPGWAPTRHVFAQRYDADGSPVWADEAIISNAGGISAWTQIFPMINDGNDGFFIAWHDDRDNDMNARVFVQHISADGEVLFADNGTEASTQLFRENYDPFLAFPSGSEDIFVFWNEMDADQNNRGIYGQKISPAGERLWTNYGKAFIEISSTNVYPFSGSSAGEDMIVFYEKFSNVMDAGIMAMRIDQEGSFVWPGQMVGLCAVQSQKIHPEAGHFAFGQWIAAWEDMRNGNADIYAQNIQLDGSLGPITIGEVEVHPDTLYFEENPQTKQVLVVNNTLEPCIITYVDAIGDYWTVDPYPTLPYEIPGGESVMLDVHFEFITSGQLKGYYYDSLHIVIPPDTHTVVIAINEALLTGVNDRNINSIRVYPNPSGSSFVFDFDDVPGMNDRFVILDLSGQIIRQWDPAGEDQISWDGRNERNEIAPSGVYIYQFHSQKGPVTGKITLIR